MTTQVGFFRFARGFAGVHFRAGSLTVYNALTGETVSGTVNVTGIIPDDMELEVFAFLNSQTFTTNNIGGISPLCCVTLDETLVQGDITLVKYCH